MASSSRLWIPGPGNSLRKAWGGRISGSCCHEIGGTGIDARRFANSQQQQQLSTLSWSRRGGDFPPRQRAPPSFFLRHFSSATLNSLNQQSATFIEEDDAPLATVSRRAPASDSHSENPSPARHNRGGHHRFPNIDDRSSRRDVRNRRHVAPSSLSLRDKIQYVLSKSSVPVGRMSPQDHELALDAIRWVEQHGLRNRQREGSNHLQRPRGRTGHQSNDQGSRLRPSDSKNHDLDLWRRGVDVLRRIEHELSAHHRQQQQQYYPRGHRHNNQSWGVTVPPPPPPLPALTTTPYNRLLRSVARIPDLTADEKVQLADDLLKRMLQDSSSTQGGGVRRGDTNAAIGVVPKPDRYTYQAYLYACVEASKEHPADSHIALDRAKALIQHLETQEVKNASRSRHNDSSSEADDSLVLRSYYDAIIQIHSNQASEVYGAAAAAEDALLHLSELSTTRPALQPTAESFNRVLRAWSACRESNGADRAHEILKLQLSLGSSAAPDAVSFGTVMAAYGKRQCPDDAQHVWEQCVEWLGEKQVRGDATDNDDDENRVDLTGCFEVLVAAWSQSRRPEAVPRIKDLIRTVVHESHDSYVVRDTPTIHSCLIQAMVAEGKALAANEYLVEMVARCRQGSGPIPLTRAFHTVLGGWKDVIASEPSQALIAAQRSLSLIKEMLSLQGECPTETATFYLVTEVLCHALSASKGLPPEIGEDVSRIARHGMADVVRDSELRRQSRGVMYHRIVQALCRHSTPESSKMAAQVLDQYYQQAMQRRDVEWIAKQVTGLYTSVIAALASCRTLETSEHALEIFRSMPTLSGRSGRDLALVPTVRTYTSALRAVACLRDDRSAAVTAEIFEELKRLDADPDHRVKFDGIVFAVLLEASAANAELCRQVASKIVELRRSGRAEFDDQLDRYRSAFVEALVKSGRCEGTAHEEVEGMFA